MDAVDKSIVTILQREGRMTNVELAQRIGLTPAPTLTRVHKLEEQGYIQGYAAIVDRDKIGLPVTAFVSVILKEHGKEIAKRFIETVSQFEQVLEVHHIAGEEDYLLKVVAANPRDYELFVLDNLTGLETVQRVKTTFVLSSPKSTTVVPIRHLEELGGTS